MKNIFALLGLTLSSYQLCSAQAQLYVTNGKVYNVVSTATTVYICGSFTQVGPAIPYGVAINTKTSLAKRAYAKPNGAIATVVADGAGGWYVGGQFSAIGSTARNNLAQIDASGHVTSWNPNPNAPISALAIFGNTVYAGGGFTTIGGSARNRLASINGATGAANSWNPNSNGIIYSLAISGRNIFVGGFFTTIGGASRNRLAAIDTNSGLATGFDPDANSGVYTLAFSGSTVYAGGNFTGTIGGATSPYLAALDSASGAAISGFSSGVDGLVNALASDGSNLYASGQFTTAGGSSRSGLAALSTSTGTASSFNPSPPYGASSLLISGDTLFVGGGFNTISSTTRNGLAAYSISTSSLLSINPNIAGTVKALAIAGSILYTGGDFGTVGGIPRNYIAALDVATGMPLTTFDPNADQTVNTLALSPSGNKIYVGGNFGSIAGSTIYRLAALNTSNGTNVSGFSSPFSSTSGGPSKLLLSPTSGVMYVAGGFADLGSVTGTANLLALDTATGSISTGFLPAANNPVSSLAIDPSGSPIYAGGSFSSIGGASRTRLAALSTSTGAASSFNPSPNSNVSTMVLDGTTLFVGGNFNSIGGATRNRIAAISTSTGTAISGFDPNADGGVSSLLVSGTTLYVGGNFFSNIAGVSRNCLAALNKSTGVASSSFNPGVGGSVQAMSINGSALYVGGGYSVIGGKALQSIAVLDAITGVPLAIKLQSFGAIRRNEQSATINWKVAAAADNVQYSIEKSSNGRDYSLLTTLSGNAFNLAYTYDDMEAAASTIYYRLKVIESSGAISYSKIAVVMSGSVGNSLTLFPVPTDGKITIINTNNNLDGSDAVVSDLQGRVVCRLTISGRTNLDVSHWRPGIYWLRTIDGKHYTIQKH
ncbi:MAG: T9SS type A sorting domain-containing protein [Chitinophagaceae bacterium]